VRSKAIAGTALAVAMAAMTMGASSASATALCVAEQEVCKRVNVYPKGTSVVATTAEAKFKTSLFTITCTESKAEGKITVEDGSPMSGQITALSFDKCEGGCLVKMTNLPYAASIEWTGGDDGAFIAKEGEKGAISAAISCPLVFSCTYATGAVELSAQGGEPGELIANEEGLTKVSGTCPEEVTWTATYSVTTPKPVYVAKAVAGAKLCKTVPEKSGGTLKCPAGQGFSGAVSGKLEAGKQATFTSTKGKSGTVSCSEAPLSGAFSEKAVATEPLSITFKSGGDCTSTLSGNPTVTVEMLPQPFDAAGFEYVGQTAPESALWFTRAAGGPEPTLKFTSGVEECFYEITTSSLPVTNGVGAGATKALIAMTWSLSVGDAICPEAIAQLVPLELTTKVYVAGA
jgi:hypothetical protein